MVVRPMIVPEDYSPDNMPSEKVVELHKKGPNEHNAEIVLMENGIEIPGGRFVYRDSLARKWGGVKELLPDVPVQTSNGRQVKEGKYPKERVPSMKKGVPPIYQLVYDMCDVKRGEKREDIIQRFIDLKWFGDVEFVNTEDSINKALEYLKDRTLITIDPDRKTYHSGPKTFDYYYDLEDEGYDIKEGPYPVVRLIRDKLSERGTMKKYDLLDLLVDWNWVINREYGKKWINHALKRNYIRHIGDGVLEPYRSF